MGSRRQQAGNPGAVQGINSTTLRTSLRSPLVGLNRSGIALLLTSAARIDLQAVAGAGHHASQLVQLVATCQDLA